MKWLGILAASTVFIFFACVERADALYEFCPAGFTMESVGTSGEPASLFGFELNAEGSRSVTAAIAFDTSAGWFIASIPSTPLQKKDRHYDSPTASFVKRTWTSAVMYIQFPASVAISHSWVYSAQSAGDTFGWSKMGFVSCQPSATALPPATPLQVTQAVKLDPKDEDHLSSPPGPGSKVITATRTAPLKQTNCATPFQDATVTKVTPTEYPTLARRPAIDVTSTIQVAINADGSLADAWVLYPSGFPAFDEAARQAALRARYRSAIAYCEAVPGLYLFKVIF